MLTNTVPLFNVRNNINSDHYTTLRMHLEIAQELVIISPKPVVRGAMQDLGSV